MASDTITCGICGYTYIAEIQEEHDKVHNEWDGSTLPSFIANVIIYRLDQILRKADSESVDPVHVEEVDSAMWALMHIWYNRENVKVKTIERRDEVFKEYRDELNSRYPALRKWKSRYV